MPLSPFASDLFILTQQQLVTQLSDGCVYFASVTLIISAANQWFIVIA